MAAELVSMLTRSPNVQAQAANARPLTLDQYLPNQLKQETSSTTGSPERFSAQNSTAALPAAPTAPTRGSAQSLRPKIAVPTSRVAPPNSSFARPNENSSARISNAAASSHAAVIGVCAPSSKPYSEVENKVEASTKGVLSIEKSLGDLSFLGEGDDDLEAPQSFCCPITTVSNLSKSIVPVHVCFWCALGCLHVV